MRRRELVSLATGATVLCSFPARAQRREPMRKVAVLMGLSEANPDTRGFVREFRNALDVLGWTVGQNLTLIYRFAEGDPEQAGLMAKEVVALQPDLIVGHTTPVAAALQQATKDIPIVFVSISSTPQQTRAGAAQHC